MIFLTVGTSFPFDRLIRIVKFAYDKGFIDDRVIAQVGVGGYKPSDFSCKEIMEKEEFDELFIQADMIISHAGMGTISMALDQGKPLLVVPRLKKYGELVNDHQRAAAEKYEKLGHLLTAYGENDFLYKFKELKDFTPKPRNCHVREISKEISRFIEKTLAESR